jgi:hypothetical protein
MAGFGKRAVRGVVMVVALALATAVSGCERLGFKIPGAEPSAQQSGAARERSGPRTVADTAVDEVATGEPGKDRFNWRAGNDSARTVAGNVTASLPEGSGGPLALAFANGITLKLDVLGLHRGGDRMAPRGDTIAAILGSDPRASVSVYRVAQEDVDRSAPKGGLCGAVPTRHVAVTEYVTEQGDWTFRIAAFKGIAAPGADNAVDPEFCSVFVYSLN